MTKIIRLYSPRKSGAIGKTDNNEPFIDIECREVEVTER